MNDVVVGAAELEGTGAALELGAAGLEDTGAAELGVELAGD